MMATRVEVNVTCRCDAGQYMSRAHGQDADVGHNFMKSWPTSRVRAAGSRQEADRAARALAASEPQVASKRSRLEGRWSAETATTERSLPSGESAGPPTAPSPIAQLATDPPDDELS